MRRSAAGTCVNGSRKIPPAARASPPKPTVCSWIIRRTGSRPKRWFCCRLWRKTATCAAASMPCSAATASTSPMAAQSGTRSCVRAPMPASTGSSTAWRFRRQDPRGRSDPQRGQHRHRRQRSRAGHGLQGLAPLQPPRADLPLREQVDGTHFAQATRDLKPAETLFTVAGKTFSTPETMAYAQAARKWIVGALGESLVADHFVAVSTAEAGSSGSASIPGTCSASGTGSAAAT